MATKNELDQRDTRIGLLEARLLECDRIADGYYKEMRRAGELLKERDTEIATLRTRAEAAEEATRWAQLRLEQAREENERLRAALEEVHKLLWAGNRDHPAAALRFAAWKTAGVALGYEQNAAKEASPPPPEAG